jgi:pimeloyl-ACP methyl ester carboxylesterase
MRLTSTLTALALVGAAPQTGPRTAQGVLSDGAKWSATVPAAWNGTLLVYGHGYARTLPDAEDAPKANREALLEAGYALAGSTYADAGWALESAVPDQVETIDQFSVRFGKPKRVIAWGMSMGALVTTALAEQRPHRIDGAVAFCGSIGGAVGMMNSALDGAYAFRTLLAPEAGIELVNVKDDIANGARVAMALAAVRTTAAGRARVALVGVLAGIPGWTSFKGRQPAMDDFVGQEAEIAKTAAMGVFLPRGDQERRAGGAFSWNNGINYSALLKASGREPMVRALYKTAGLDLDADLAKLYGGQRITAKASAVRYMMANYTPNARPTVPYVAVQMIGDGLTSPSLQRAYVESAQANGAGRDIKSLYVAGAGHCTFDTPTIVDAIGLVDSRLRSAKWPLAPTRFVPYTPPPMLRKCVRGDSCK